MKLKSIIFAAAMVAAATAQADIVQIERSGVYEDGSPKSPIGYDARGLYSIEHSVNSDNKSTIVILSGDEAVDARFSYTGFSDESTIKFLRPEKIGIESDLPASLSIMRDKNYDLQFNCRVFLLEGADPNEVVDGYVNSNYKLYAVSENIAQEGSNERGLTYRLGGEYGTEALFTIVVSSGPVWNILINNTTRANSFEDFIQIPAKYYNWNFGLSYRNMYWSAEENVKYSAKNQPYALDLPLWVNEYIVRHGAKVTYELDEFFYRDETDKMIRLNPNDVKFDSELIIGPDAEHPMENQRPNFHIEMNCGDLGSEEYQEVYCWVNVKFELNEGAPQWLEELCKYEIADRFAITLKIQPTHDIEGRIESSEFTATFPDIETSEGSLSALFDDAPTTFCHSAWSKANQRSEPYGSYIDFEFNEPKQEIGFAMQLRDYYNPIYPQTVDLYYSNDGVEWTKFASVNDIPTGKKTCEWVDVATEPGERFEAPEPFKYLRWCVIKNSRGEKLTQTSKNVYWNLAELHLCGK